MGLATREAACDGQTKNLSELIRAKSSISQDECSELFEYLEVDNNTFTKEQRTSIAQLANTRCGSLMDQGASASGDSHQKNLHLQFYYPAWLWSIIKSDDNMRNKIMHTAEFWVKHLGIRQACEQTKRLGIAILHVAADLPVDPNLAYEHLHELQEIIVAKRPRIPGSPTLNVFPKDPNKFWEQYPEAYSKEHPPAKCGICEMTLFHRNTKTCTPARSSNKKVHSKRVKHTAPQPIANTGNDSWKDQMMAFMLEKQSGAPPPTNRHMLDQPARGTHDAHGRHTPHVSVIVDEQSESTLSVPSDVGGLPGVLKALAPSQGPSDKMAKIREDIAAAVATKSKGKDNKKKKKKKTKKDSDSSSDSEIPVDDAGEKKHGAEKVDKTATKDEKRKKRTKDDKPKKSDGKRPYNYKWYNDPDAIKIMKRPAAARPSYTDKPVEYKKGKIYFSKAKEAFRVYLKRTDRVERQVRVADRTKASMRDAFQYSCGLIESDPR